MKRGTLIFASVVALVAGYAVYDFKSEKMEIEKKSEQSLMFNLKIDQVQHLSIFSEKGEIQLQREKQGWQLIKPAQDETNESVVNEFLEGLASEKSLDVAVESKQLDLAQFGLDHPLGSILVRDNAGAQVTFTVGKGKNFQGDSFVRIDESPQVLVASSTWFSKIQKTANDFRDRRWMRMSAAGTVKIEIKRAVEKGFEKFQLVKQEDSWQSPEHPAWKLDQNKVREILAMLNATEGLEVISEPQNPPKTEELKTWGFQQPKVQLKVLFKQGTEEIRTWEGTIATGTDKVHRIQINTPAMIYKISPTDSDKFSNMSLDSLRDRSVPFEFDKTKIEKISWSGLSNEKAPEKLETVTAMMDEKGRWASSQGELDPEKVNDFFQKLSSLHVVQFLDQKVSKLDKEISFLTEDGSKLFKIRWGAAPKSKDSKPPVVLAETSSYSGIISILESDMNHLQLDELLKKTEVKK